MDQEARRASLGLIFLVSIMVIHRHWSLPSSMTGPTHVFGATPSSSVPERSAELDSELKYHEARLAELRQHNVALRGQQMEILAEIGKRNADGVLHGAQMRQDDHGVLRSLRSLFPGDADSAAFSPSSSSAQPLIDTTAIASSSFGMVSQGGGAAAAALEKAKLGRITERGRLPPPRRRQDDSTSPQRLLAALAPPPPPLPPPPTPPLSSSSSSSLLSSLPTTPSSSKHDGKVVSFYSRHRSLYLTVDEKGWLVGDADANAPLSKRSFRIVDAGSGWVAIKAMESGLFIEMVPRTQPLAWVVRESANPTQGGFSERQKWKINGERILNAETRSFVNLINGGAIRAAVRGHGNEPNKRIGAGPEPSTVFQVVARGDRELKKDRVRVATAVSAEAAAEAEAIERIRALPTSQEKRVVSYGLYGSNPKYVVGAVRNSELAKVYFPGWVCRFYCDATVPREIIQQLETNGAEVVFIENIRGAIAGMFWRFLVADDATVDRYIVRDTDSRLNARERFAVEEWIQSGKGVHSIRDHPNHERPLNGGLWGGTKGAVQGMTKLVKNFSNKGKYGLDLTFLNEKVWPTIKHNQMSHDAYTCSKFPNSRPFPTRRLANYQHVGQVFTPDGPGGADKARMGDINGFMRGRETPLSCRKQPGWKFG